MTDRNLTADRHTPGPWWVDNRRPVGALQIQGRHRGEGSSYCVASVNYYEDDAANASLIAAAPEMLNSLRDLMGIFDGLTANVPEEFAILERARAVIAKAEGKL